MTAMLRLRDALEDTNVKQNKRAAPGATLRPRDADWPLTWEQPDPKKGTSSIR